MKALVLISDRTVPTVTGTRVRSHYLWPAMTQLGVDVRILGINLDRNEKNPEGPSKLPCHFFSHERGSLPFRLWKSLSKSFQEWPRSEKLLQAVTNEVKNWKPDIIHAEELRMAYYLPAMQNIPTMAKQTITFHNVETELLKRTGSSPYFWGRPLIEKIHQVSFAHYEKKSVHSADLCLAYSEVDYKKYSSLYPSGQWATTMNGTNALSLQPQPQTTKPSILIVGSLSYAPNIHGLNWFLQEVLPELPKDFQVTVAGSRASAIYKKELQKYNITFVDTPSELAPYFENSSLCAVPVFEGSGTRGKILESLAQERMVITTQLGIEGLDFNEASGVIIANDKDNFRKALIEWATNPDKRILPAQRGRQKVIDEYDWAVVAKKQKELWESLCTSSS